ncbi:glycosyltransferase family 9 protein [Fundidesulfovibrio soli]|uniref:glycosyltransferase family 9 protein n=1 Tax=Fundidesulfovibrio soli TaxID=2922716 RepID=UPI001FAF14D6|nr:glycosyltransferase family 9 protein [Fundidesulfovibrio soli]
MKPVLVMQLARFGDLLQTKRLVAGLEQAGRPVHLLVDSSLAGLARLVYPRAVVHAVAAHSRPDLAALRESVRELGEAGFRRVYNLNYSGLSAALTTAFDPETVRGHRLEQGQPQRDPWAGMAFRWTRRRRQAGVNLADFWAGYALPLADASSVNPVAEPKGGGLGVALAGRDPRRSPPPRVLAGVIQALLPTLGAVRVTLLGTASERLAAKELTSLLPERVAQSVTDLTGRTSLEQLVDTVAGLDRLLTPDTGIMHLAAHLGVPVTGLFLSNAWCHETGPYGLGHTVWQATLDCAPCLEAAPCPNEVACLDPFASREFLRLATGKAGVEPPAGLTGYATGFDALGVCCEPFCGPDPGRAERLALRAFAARSLGIGGDGYDPAPGLVEDMVADPDFMLPKHQALLETL